MKKDFTSNAKIVLMLVFIQYIVYKYKTWVGIRYMPIDKSKMLIDKC